MGKLRSDVPLRPGYDRPLKPGETPAFPPASSPETGAPVYTERTFHGSDTGADPYATALVDGTPWTFSDGIWWVGAQPEPEPTESLIEAAKRLCAGIDHIPPRHPLRDILPPQDAPFQRDDAFEYWAKAFVVHDYTPVFFPEVAVLDDGSAKNMSLAIIRVGEELRRQVSEQCFGRPLEVDLSDVERACVDHLMANVKTWLPDEQSAASDKFELCVAFQPKAVIEVQSCLEGLSGILLSAIGSDDAYGVDIAGLLEVTTPAPFQDDRGGTSDESEEDARDRERPVVRDEERPALTWADYRR